MFSLIHHGRKSHKLHLKSPVLNLLLQNACSVSTTPNLTPEDDLKRKTFTVSYLINSLGLTTKLAESISKKANFSEKANPDSVLKLLRSYGFKNSQISTIIATYPKFLIENPEKALRGKLHFLKLNGASRSELTEIVSKVPKILGKRGEKQISQYYDYVKDILQERDNESPKGEETNRSRNLSILRGLGVPGRSLVNLLISKAHPVGGKERFEECVKKIVEMGFDPASPRFVNALFVFYELSEKTVEQKVEVYKSLGFLEDEVWRIFKKWPFCLKFSEAKITQTFTTLKGCGLSEEEIVVMVKKFPVCVGTSEEKIVNAFETLLGLGFTRDEVVKIMKLHPQCIGLAADTIRRKVEFLVKGMGWPVKAVATAPIVLGFSLEKFIIPRCTVIKALVENGLIGKVPALPTVLTSAKERFLKCFVEKHKDMLPELRFIFAGDRVTISSKAS